MRSLRSAMWLALAAAMLGAGCASTRVAKTESAALVPQVERGQPRKFVDGVGWVLGIPEKVLLWDRRAENHHVSAETEQSVVEYMAANGMESTKVRINQYAPGDEWRRLAANKSVGAGWRYTFGALRTLGYTVFPGRLIGNDGYNPYTDTVSIYSDIPALAMEQAGHAKIVRGQAQPGTYATVFSLPVLALFPEKRAKDDVLEYVAWDGGPAAEAAAMRTLYPQYGTEIGGEIGAFVPGLDPLLTLAGAGVGHAVGWYGSRGLEHDAEQVAAASATSAPLAPPDGEVLQTSAIEPATVRN
jgi:hypothetical protein